MEDGSVLLSLFLAAAVDAVTLSPAASSLSLLASVLFPVQQQEIKSV